MRTLLELSMLITVVGLLGAGSYVFFGPWCDIGGPCASHREAAPERHSVRSLSEAYLELAERRQRHLGELNAYWQTGVFPRNTDFQGQQVPYFVDRQGRRCAVAQLLWLDGEAHLVDKIAESNNHVRVMEVTGGPFFEWIGRSGLTREECARIQPTYGFRRLPEPTPAELRWEAFQERLATMTREAQRETLRVYYRLEKVEGQLRRQTQHGLRIALQRLLPELRRQLGKRSLGFLLRPCKGSGLRVLRNQSDRTIRARVLRVNARGGRPVQGGWFTLRGHQQRVLPATREIEISPWIFIEWESQEVVAPEQVVLVGRGA